MRKISSRFFLAGLFAAAAHAGADVPGCKLQIDLSDGAHPRAVADYFEWDGTPKHESVELSVTPTGTRFYHWTKDPEAYGGWVKQGAVPQATITEAMQRGGFVGGGIYVSTGVYDSHRYGNHVVVFEAPRDLLTLPYRLYMALVAPDEKSCAGLVTEEALLKLGLDGTHDREKTWLNLMSAASLSKVTGEGHSETVLSQIHDMTLCELAELDGLMTIEPGPALKEYYPALNAVLSGDALAPAELKTLRDQLSEAMLPNTASVEHAVDGRVMRKNCGHGDHVHDDVACGPFLAKLDQLLKKRP